MCGAVCACVVCGGTEERGRGEEFLLFAHARRWCMCVCVCVSVALAVRGEKTIVARRFLGPKALLCAGGGRGRWSSL